MLKKLCASKKEKIGAARDFSFDNLRFFLILAVVFGHLIESAPPFQGDVWIYHTIYSFHMPMFFFIAGYYAKYRPKRIIFQWILPYFAFQTLYIFYARIVLHANLPLQYSTPYWLLWFMLTSIFYLLLLPLFEVRSKRLQGIILLGAILLALIAGFDQSLGYSMSLSRTLVFLPWFLIGLYYRRSFEQPLKPFLKKYRILLGILCSLLVIGAILILKKLPFTNSLFYGALPYATIKQPPHMRAIVMLLGLIWVAFLIWVARPMLQKKLPLITMIGQNTLPIFLLHGFITRALPLYAPTLVSSLGWVCLSAAAILLLLGNSFFKRIVYILGCSWLEKCTNWLSSKK